MPENAVRLRRTSHPFGLLALVAFVTLVSVTGALAQVPAAKNVLTIGDYARWKSIENSRITATGTGWPTGADQVRVPGAGRGAAAQVHRPRGTLPQCVGTLRHAAPDHLRDRWTRRDTVSRGPATGGGLRGGLLLSRIVRTAPTDFTDLISHFLSAKSVESVGSSSSRTIRVTLP